MLLIAAVKQLRAQEGSLSEQHRELFQDFMVDLCRHCCSGGVEAQHKGEQETLESLKLSICGDSEGAAKAEAEALLRQCQANCRNNCLPNLQRHRALGDLKEPNLEMNVDSSAVDYKHAYNRIWRAAVQTYLFEMIHAPQYEKGPEVGLRMIRFQWAKPDEALRKLRPSTALEKAIAFWQEELEVVLADLRTRHGIAQCPSTNGNAVENGYQQPVSNPRGAIGLDNPGENLCATNSLIQFLFSAESFRRAVLEVPEAVGDAPGSATAQAPAPLYTTLEQESRQLVVALRLLFVQMSDPSRRSTSVREVAKILYSGELGQQQDSDELMHRMSSLLQDGLEAIPGDPYASLRRAFCRLFVGATFEVQVRRDVKASASEKIQDAEKPSEFEVVVRTTDDTHVIGYPLDQTSSNKHFLCIPVQRGNETLMQALEDFTCWAPTGGSDVVWMQEQFRTMPPFLSFATRQVSRLEWEEALNLTRFAVRATPSMQRDRYERAKVRQLRSELGEALRHLGSGSESLEKANLSCACQLDPEFRSLAEMLRRLQHRAETTDQRLTELDEQIGDGFDEPPVPEFLRGVVDANVISNVVCGLLGANTVKKLADLVFDGDENGNDTLEQLVQSGALARTDEARIGARLQQRWEEHRTHMYDVYALVVYQGTGHAGHYVVFVRQSDGAFLCFDDEHVSEHPCAGAVRAHIAERGSEAYPASVRMVVYRRRTEGPSEPLELPGPRAAPNDTSAPGAADGDGPNGGDAKRRRTE